MATSTPLALYKPANGEVGWGTAVRNSIETIDDRITDIGVNVKAASYGALGNGAAADYSALANAITAAGVGGTVIIPDGDYIHASTLVPLNGQRWVGSGRGTNNFRVGTRLRYTGTGVAVDLSGVQYARFENMEFGCTNTGSGVRAAKMSNESTSNIFDNVHFFGPSSGTGAGTGVWFDGQTGCSCHNEFRTCRFWGWATCLRMSGYANANVFTNCHYSVGTTAIDLSKTGTDTMGGSDNGFFRCEIGSGITNGVKMNDAANRNQFYKLQLDSPTTEALNIASSSCLNNGFNNCYFPDSLAFTDNGYNTSFDHVPAGSHPVGEPLWTVGGVGMYKDTYAPESALTANPGSMYIRTSNGEWYLKVTGTGNTGWKAVTHA